jgi:hypothetical protein
MMKSPRVSEKLNIDPATTPGNASGRVIRRNVVAGRAPRSPEASSTERGTRSSEAEIGRIM